MTVDELTRVMIALIGSGTTLRIIFCLFKMMSAEEDNAMYKKKAVNALIFLIIVSSAWAIKDMVFHYFG